MSYFDYYKDQDWRKKVNVSRILGETNKLNTKHSCSMFEEFNNEQNGEFEDYDDWFSKTSTEITRAGGRVVTLGFDKCVFCNGLL